MPDISIPGGGGGGAAGAVALIASSVATGTEGTITFSNIPATYSHLQVIIAAATGATSNQALNLRMNADASALYDFSFLTPDTDAAWSRANIGGGTVGQTSARIGTTGGPGTPTTGLFTFANYAQPDQMRGFAGMMNRTTGATGATQETETSTGHWRSTAVVTSLSFICGTAAFASGARFSLYGLS